MKKFYFTSALILALALGVDAQDKDKQSEFDKKWRFGLRVAAQPTWFSSNDNNNKPAGALFGTGFGLNVERRLSQIVAFSFGIGADFEGGKYNFRYDTVNHYVVSYAVNTGGEFVQPKQDAPITEMNNASNTVYILKDRRVKTTHVSIPFALKLSTNEYSGFKYFGMFGGEIGIRVKATAKENYVNSWKFNSSGVPTNAAGEGPSTLEDINISKDASLVPLRVGFNAGLGAEYRLGGSTSIFFSLNYFRSFTNLLRNDSKYLVYNVDSSDPNKIKYSFVKQNLIQNAIRINVGILF